MFQHWASTSTLDRVVVVKERLLELLHVIETKQITEEINAFIRQVIHDAPLQRYDVRQTRDGVALYILESHSRLLLNEQDEQCEFEPFKTLEECMRQLKTTRDVIPTPEDLLRVAFTVCVEGNGLTPESLLAIERMDAHIHCHHTLLDMTTDRLSEIPCRVEERVTQSVRRWHEFMIRAQQSDDMHTKTKDLICKYRIHESDFQLPDTIPMCKELNPAELRYHLACARIVLESEYQEFDIDCERAFKTEESVFAFVSYFMRHEGVADWLDTCWLHFRWPFHAYKKIQVRTAKAPPRKLRFRGH